MGRPLGLYGLCELPKNLGDALAATILGGFRVLGPLMRATGVNLLVGCSHRVDKLRLLELRRVAPLRQSVVLWVLLVFLKLRRHREL